MLPKLRNALVSNRFWRSLFRFAYPSNEKAQAQIIHGVFLTHIHPIHVDIRSIRLSYTWGLGLISFFLFVVLFGTGVLLMFFYVPFAGRAYEDILGLETTVEFGRLLRSIHRWAAHFMVATVFLHMLRVFYTRAYRPPREFNWVVGVGLFVLTLLLSFTGYLLPWDQLSFWAVTASTNILTYAPVVGEKVRLLLLGASEVGQETLLRFYVLHVMVLPTLATAMVAFHFWRVRKDGGLAASQVTSGSGQVDIRAPATAGPRENDLIEEDQPSRPSVSSTSRRRVLTWPNLIMLETLVGLGVLAFVLIFSMLVPAPLRAPANPDVTENPSKAPWFLVNIQELFPHMGILLGGILIPTLVIVALIAVPYIDQEREGAGVWFSREGREKWLALGSGLYALSSTITLVFLDGFFPIRSLVPRPVFLSATVIPAAIILALALLLHVALRPLRPTRRETLAAYFTAFVVTYSAATIIGSFFRGPGFSLVLPWKMGPSGLSF